MEREKIEQRVREIVEDTWYNMRSINPVELQTKAFTDLVLEIHNEIVERDANVVHEILNEGGNILNASNHAKKELLKLKINNGE